MLTLCCILLFIHLTLVEYRISIVVVERKNYTYLFIKNLFLGKSANFGSYSARNDFSHVGFLIFSQFNVLWSGSNDWKSMWQINGCNRSMQLVSVFNWNTKNVDHFDWQFSKTNTNSWLWKYFMHATNVQKGLDYFK